MDRIWERFSLNEAFIRIIIKSYHKNNMKICTDWCHSSLRINNNFHNWSDVWRIRDSLEMYNPYIAENRWVSIVIEFSVVRIVEIEDFPIWISFHIIHAFYCSPINLLTFTLNWTLIKFSTRLATYKKKTSHVCCGPKPLYKHKMLHWRIIHVNALI